ncbi:MAG: hypothetical protein ACLQUY_24560 [Ktedonobacterales bacterium]
MVTVPIKRDLMLAYLISGIVALIVSVASVAGLLYGSRIYPASQISSDTGTDALNLVLGLPILLGSMWLARRGSLIGLLCWPGALFYILYVYIFYVLGVPFNALFLPYVVLVTLSAYTTIALVASIDGEAVRRRLSGGVPARTTAGLLILIAILFTAVDVIGIVTTLASRTPVDPATRVSWIADFTVQLPALLIVGILLWRGEALGYVAAPGLLLQGSVLNAGFALVLLLQAIFTGSAINAPFVALVFVIGAISFILLVFFVRGAVRGQLPVWLGAKEI